jgi:hypothetical protein
MSDSSLNGGSVKSSPEHAAKPPQRIGKNAVVVCSFPDFCFLCIYDFALI